MFNSESRNVCQLSYLHQICAVGNEERKILESRTGKVGIFERTFEKEEATGELARQKEERRVEERGEIVKTSAFVTLTDKCLVSFRRTNNQLQEVYVSQDARSFCKVDKI